MLTTSINFLNCFSIKINIVFFLFSIVSGFVSMHSIRASMQSVTAKRLSNEQQHQQQQTSSIAVTNKSINSLNLSSIGAQLHPQQKSLSNNSTDTYVKNMSNAVSSSSITTNKTSSSSLASLHASRNLLAKENFLKMSSYETLSADGHEASFDNFSTATSITSSCKNSFEQIMTSNSMMHDNVFSADGETGDGVGDETDDVPPALPIKTRQRSTRRERHLSQHDNAEETDNFPK